MSVCFAYDHRNQQDGSGAQIQRILATYSLSQEFGLGYLHSPVLNIDLNPGDSIDSEIQKFTFIEQLNKAFDLSPLNCSHVHTQSTLENSFAPSNIILFKVWLQLIRAWAFMFRKSVLFLVSNPYVYIEQRPDIYDHIRGIEIPFLNSTKGMNQKFRISVHILRAKISPALVAERFQSTEWYRRVITEIIEATNLDPERIEVTLHTDAPQSAAKWKLAQSASAATYSYWGDKGLIDEHGTMPLIFEDFSKTLDGVKNLKIVRDITPLEAWADMANTDVLILGKSSFSFVGGLLNRNGVVVSPRFFCKPLSRWFLTEDTEGVSEELILAIKSKVESLGAV